MKPCETPSPVLHHIMSMPTTPSSPLFLSYTAAKLTLLPTDCYSLLILTSSKVGKPDSTTKRERNPHKDQHPWHSCMELSLAQKYKDAHPVRTTLVSLTDRVSQLTLFSSRSFSLMSISRRNFSNIFFLFSSSALMLVRLAAAF